MTPRDSFLRLPQAKEWQRILADAPAVEIACEFALLQLQSEMPPSILPDRQADPFIGFDANSQMQGAMRVLRILKTLCEPQGPPTQPKRNTLNYA